MSWVLGLIYGGYFVLGIASIASCLVINRHRGVVSTFKTLPPSPREFGQAILDMVFLAPLALPLVVLVPLIVPLLFIIWPVLCLLDLSFIPPKRREKLRVLKAKQKTNALARAKRHAIWGRKREYDGFIGRCGRTVSVLSPMGHVRIGGKIQEAISVDGYIDYAKSVVVTGRRGKTLEVTCVDKGA